MRLECLSKEIRLIPECDVDVALAKSLADGRGAITFTRTKKGYYRASPAPIDDSTIDEAGECLDMWNDQAKRLGLARHRSLNRARLKQLDAVIRNGDLEHLKHVIANVDTLDWHVNTWGGISLFWLLANPDKIPVLYSQINAIKRQTAMSEFAKQASSTF